MCNGQVVPEDADKLPNGRPTFFLHMDAACIPSERVAYGWILRDRMGQLVPESRVIQKMVFRKGLCLFLFVAKWTAKKSNKAL